MHKLKWLAISAITATLLACSSPKPQKATPKKGYLKENISAAELNNPQAYKKYYYSCRNQQTGEISSLTSYFPLSRESRLKDNFGIYVQVDGAKPEAFDHVENRALNARGSRFEVIYRAYRPIEGVPVTLVAHQNNSIYYKNIQGEMVPWLNCRE